MLGTDGFGAVGYARTAAQAFLKWIDTISHTLPCMHLYRRELISTSELLAARTSLGIDPDKVNPVLV